jgi:hypothetical protein
MASLVGWRARGRPQLWSQLHCWLGLWWLRVVGMVVAYGGSRLCVVVACSDETLTTVPVALHVSCVGRLTVRDTGARRERHPESVAFTAYPGTFTGCACATSPSPIARTTAAASRRDRLPPPTNTPLASVVASATQSNACLKADGDTHTHTRLNTTMRWVSLWCVCSTSNSALRPVHAGACQQSTPPTGGHTNVHTPAHACCSEGAEHKQNQFSARKPRRHASSGPCTHTAAWPSTHVIQHPVPPSLTRESCGQTECSAASNAPDSTARH